LREGAGGVPLEGEGQKCSEFDFGSSGVVFSGDTSNSVRCVTVKKSDIDVSAINTRRLSKVMLRRG